MSGKATTHPGREKVNQLLKAVGSRAKEEETPVEATEYNWHEPHYFSQAQLLKLEDFARRLAAALANKFSGFCRDEFDVTVASTTQHFADAFLMPPSEGEPGDYYLPFGAGPEHICGLIGLPDETAIVWARQLLGDAESDKSSDKTLSQLEESLLLDLTSALVEGFSRSYASVELRPADRLVKGTWPIELTGVEELCKISFDVRQPGSEDTSKAYFLMTCEKLEPVVGTSTQPSAEFSVNDISRAILNHLQTMPVTVTAQLASTTLTFEEVMNLQVDDILLLDKKVDEPAALVIDGRTVCCGWPTRSVGKYAVTIAHATVEETI
ncbi:MAG: FliM/FliN family flagellar motor switch protein [Phycisphaerales bacterium]|nr:MAG: FliM/FliN family flagellar motor switch protein [Phycisphaerales bacterium]